jgi:very-short-patch-repair endonuclease
VIRLLCTQGGVLRRQDHPDLAGSIDWLIRRGSLEAVLPGVYSAPEWRQNPILGMRCALLRHRDGVLIGGAAARVSFWPTAPLQGIQLAVPYKVRPQRGFTFIQRAIPPDLIVERDGLRLTSPALTALDLATEACADSIDVALRTRAATLTGMHAVLARTAKRSGNQARLRLLLDSRDEPWSAAERRAHRLLRGAKITGWKGNLPVVVRDQLYYLDVGFRRECLALEIDGRLHRDNPELFESDRRRQNALVLAGWRVLRFTWRMLDDDPAYLIDQVRRALP